ncbi:MAG: DUF2066 domain-containing protein [Rhodanobacter sp.]|nr:DUF2066 domain-containing protein [Rhodanobacter sp.]
MPLFMSLRSALCGFLFMFVVVAPLAQAAAPDGYVGEAPVASQADGERAQALKTALSNVIVAQTGNSGALERPDVAKAIAQADRYVLRYSYRRNPDAAADSGVPALTLVAQFDSAAVDALLQRLGLTAADTHATATETSSGVMVWIDGIHNAGDYVRVMGYLARSNLVRDAQPIQANANGIRVRLSLTGGLAHFLDTVGLEHTLAVSNTPAPGERVDATLALVQ